MDTREAGRQAVQRWTGLLSAAGIALTGVIGFGTYHLIEANKAAAASGAGSTSTGAGSAPTVTDDGGGLVQTGGDDGGESSDGGGSSNLAPRTSQGGFGPGSGPSMTGSSGS